MSYCYINYDSGDNNCIDRSYVAERLCDIANNLTPAVAGHFAAGGPAAGLPNPLLRVVGGGGDYLGWPVGGAQVDAAIAAGAATRAPYGLGEATVTNAVVRDSWKVLPGQLTWDNPAWDGALQALVREAAAALGVPGPVTAALHNLLLYRLGGHFAAHTDTEKGAGMFATLVVTLPSVFTGGRLLVRHNGEEETFAGYADRSEVPTAPYWAAYYSDCEHEVTPVTGGHRVVLVYNLTRPPADRDSDGDPANDAEGVLSTPPVRKELTTILTLRGWLGAPGQANSDSDDDASRPAAADLGPPSWVRGTAAVRALTPEGMEMVPSGNDGDLPTRWYRTYGLVVALAGAPNRADPTYGWYFVRGREEREYGDTAQWSGPGHTAWTTVVRK
ncbi:hypothetical protein I4F81_010528 [Pyropia yezoensis]|uniref:Uncharacterized protein n=1 Tax=Pyropia yezoensis TaxID=2788 RepID=A0ACC3CDG3_PYRYE|nr:hypothetical protein I4F81_010528 [Neopyropia yezoensis]